MEIPVALPARHAAAIRRWMTHERGDARELMTHVEAAYADLCRRTPQYENAALRNHLYNHILIGLALCRVLQAEGLEQKAALDQTRAVLVGTAGDTWPNLRLTKLMRRWLPGSWLYPLVRRSLRRQMRDEFPSPGWEIQWLEDSPRRVAFHLSRCFYLETLRYFGAPELTPIFCDMDDVLAAQLVPYITFKRHGTLAKGSPACDFCYRNVLKAGA